MLVYVDVKMDWCNTNINGTQLDPKVQYAQMVIAHWYTKSINSYSDSFQ